VGSATGLASLPGIDSRAGLNTTMNNEKLYTRLLLKFRDSQRRFETQFRQALAAADPEVPTRLAHTLKGNAGSIGARGVQLAAAELEQACLDGKTATQLDALLSRVLQQMAPVLAGLDHIGPVLQDKPQETKPAVVDLAPEQLAGALGQLRLLLSQSDAVAMDMADHLLDLTQGTPMAATLKLVAAELAQFDFDAALDALNQNPE
jgi:HPt (histidine-containing phosphotransfer) domain-containing protein